VDYFLFAKYATPHTHLDASMLPLVAESLVAKNLPTWSRELDKTVPFFALDGRRPKVRVQPPFRYITNTLYFNCLKKAFLDSPVLRVALKRARLASALL
jgi:hypothetical protein